jgi:hypothetical protein
MGTETMGQEVTEICFYGVVSSQTETALELFLEREQAEAFIAEVEEDQPELADELCIEEISLDSNAN